MQHETALVTGASSGIGKELARVLAENGHNLILVARNENKLLELKEELEDRHDVAVLCVSRDLSRQNAPLKIYETVQDNDWQVDLLINNAGVGDVGFFHESGWERLSPMVDVNIRALTYLTHLFLPGMVERGNGRIMNVSSTAAFQPGPLMNMYYASKHYVQAFTRALAYEVNDKGVTVTALCPGPTQSGFHTKAKTEGTKLLSSQKMPTSRQVAEFGYNAMMKGKQVAIPGMLNKIGRFMAWAAPATLLMAVVYQLHQRS